MDSESLPAWPEAKTPPVEKLDEPYSYLFEAKRHLNVARDNLKELNNLYAQDGKPNPYQEQYEAVVKLSRDLEDAYVRSKQPGLYGPATTGDAIKRGEEPPEGVDT